MTFYFLGERDVRHDLVHNLDLFFCFFVFLAGSIKAKTDSCSFLFTLVNPFGCEPVKLNPTSEGGIRCESSVGPSFGTMGYFTLQVWNVGYETSAYGYFKLGYGFEWPADKASKHTYFFGKSPFDIDELEVFEVNF